MKLSIAQKIGFVALTFALGCASSLWLESSGPSNRFFENGAVLASPISLLSNQSLDAPERGKDVPRLNTIIEE